ncbi:MAG TPA: hypothetical protein VJI15_04515 [Candidatus Nanoarchaeia archaeon]|nr:hypothetical protein [Candidatus Nanoarchaeia archaeon]
MAEHKNHSSLPYIAIVALVAVVAVVVLVLNSNPSDTSVVVDEDGNIVGEASGSFRTDINERARKQCIKSCECDEEGGSCDVEAYLSCVDKCKKEYPQKSAKVMKLIKR